VTRGIDAPEVEGYQWDGWKLIMIAKLNTNGTFHSRKWSCVWRPDVGSSLYARSDWMRAGGVGGVAWLQTGAVQSYSYGTGGAEVHVPLADHMGNVRHYYQFKSTKGNVTGQLVASFEYDAFGREVRAWGLNTPTENQPPGLPASRPWADLLPFHYSSKLRDVDSGFNYYGYRFYDPGAGRWLNRDPIEEDGGVNLYGYVSNDPVDGWDVLGMAGEGKAIRVGMLGLNLSHWLRPGNQAGEDSGFYDGHTIMGSPDFLLESTDVSEAVDSIIKGLDRDRDGKLDSNDCPPFDIRIVGYSWGGWSALQVVHRLTSSSKVKNVSDLKIRIGTLDPVPTGRSPRPGGPFQSYKEGRLTPHPRGPTYASIPKKGVVKAINYYQTYGLEGAKLPVRWMFRGVSVSGATNHNVTSWVLGHIHIAEVYGPILVKEIFEQ